MSTDVTSVPPSRYVPGPLARVGASIGFWAYQYRRTWRGTVVSSVLTPVLFLAAMGVGLGALVDDGGRLDNDYLIFLAPGLLAATAMQTGVFESMYPVMGAIKWVRTYHAMLATPLGVGDILLGHLLWVVFRVTSTAAVYLAVIALFGAAPSLTALLALPAATLCGMAFAAPIFAFSAGYESPSGFAALERFVIVPMFLFSGTFFPVSQLPEVLQWVAYATPLYHGVELCRALVGGTQTALDAVGHIGYLLLWVAGGVLAAFFFFRRRLEATG
ncbi:MAG: ABC transporter permease [Actinomycetota bacterium]|nr:ABC transporter permease [Actinomycetota bacterium]